MLQSLKIENIAVIEKAEIDFIDGFGIYKKWKKKREMYYRKIGAKIL